MGAVPPPYVAKVDQDRHRESAQSVQTATFTAIQTICWPAVVGVACLIGPANLLSASRDVIVIAAIVSVYLSVVVGSAIGAFSHYVARSKGRSAVIRMAIAISLLFDFTLWGWAMVLIYPKN